MTTVRVGGLDYTKRDGMWEYGACYRVNVIHALALDALAASQAERDAAIGEAEFCRATYEAEVDSNTALRLQVAQLTAERDALQALVDDYRCLVGRANNDADELARIVAGGDALAEALNEIADVAALRKAERDALTADNARLREALENVRRVEEWVRARTVGSLTIDDDDQLSLSAWNEARVRYVQHVAADSIAELGAALAATTEDDNAK